jgi:hypothetical protein
VWLGAWPSACCHLPPFSSASQPVTCHLPHLLALGEEQPELLAPGSNAQVGLVLQQGARGRMFATTLTWPGLRGQCPGPCVGMTVAVAEFNISMVTLVPGTRLSRPLQLSCPH